MGIQVLIATLSTLNDSEPSTIAREDPCRPRAVSPCAGTYRLVTMINRSPLLRALCLLLAGFLVVGPVSAEPKSLDLLLVQATPTVSKDEAAALARQATGGRVLDIQAEERGGKKSYRVKVLLSDGRVRIVRVDAYSGNVRD